MVTMIGYEWVDVNRAWKNPEVRLEHGVSASREGPGTLADSAASLLREFPAAPPARVPFEARRGL